MQPRSRFLIQTGLFAALATLSSGGCNPVGLGSGSATGMLWISDCKEGKAHGTPDAPVGFDLEPTFFAGEPIGDISVVPGTTPSSPLQNRLIIRMQRTGNATEINDTLYFDIPSSYQVARCLRGRIDPDGGVPDWDTGSGSLSVPADMPWCEPMGPNGIPRIHLVPFGPVRAALTPLYTCTMTTPGPSIVSITGVAKDGWIEFLDFGSATQANKPADMRGEIPNNFQVNYKDRLQARFALLLDDDRTQTAIYKMVDVPPAPQIGGTLQGTFDFDLERGRAAQTFP